MRKLRHREVQSLAQGGRDRKCRDMIHMQVGLRLELVCCPPLAASTDGPPFPGVQGERITPSLTLQCPNLHSAKPSPMGKQVNDKHSPRLCGCSQRTGKETPSIFEGVAERFSTQFLPPFSLPVMVGVFLNFIYYPHCPSIATPC